MKKRIVFLLVLFCAYAGAQRQMEYLDRGLVAAKIGNTNNAFVSWRLFATDPAGVRFTLYRATSANGAFTAVSNCTDLDAAHTNCTVTGGASTGDRYQVAAIVNNRETERSKAVSVWQTNAGNNGAYLEIPVQKPYTGAGPNGGTLTIYDGVVADLDGDGEYEVVFFWAPDNMKDNSQTGLTDNVYIDAYKLNGTKLWGAGKWINLGPNIRAGAHYQVFLVYDFDGNGKAEIIVKTADGTTDTQGNRVGNTTVYKDGNGFITTGAEYLSVFEGATGKLINTKPFKVNRDPNDSWGLASNGRPETTNRVDRFLGTVAYLDGKKPSAVMWRGYYSRTTASAWDFDGKELKERWIFDTRGMTNGSTYEGRGNHNLSVVDNGGTDMIVTGALGLNSNGTPRFTVGNTGHGDAMHAAKHIPNRDGLQVFRCMESSPYGIHMYDASTGQIIWKVDGAGDTGRGLCADIDPEYPGNECWGSGTDVYSATGTKLGAQPTMSQNMAIWWDGDTGRELFDLVGSNLDGGPVVQKMTASNGSSGNLRSYSRSNIFTFTDGRINGGTKRNPLLQADMLGDWREEVILRGPGDNSFRIYTSTIPTVHTGSGAVPSNGIPTLMQNKMYRMAITWQHAGYNQPPWVDYFLGYNMTGQVPRDNITIIGNPPPVSSSSVIQSSSSSAILSSSSSVILSSSSLTPESVLVGSGVFIDNLMLFDPPNAANWSIKTDLNHSQKTYGDREYLINSVPAELQGAEWVSSSMETRRLTASGNLIRFQMKQDGVVYVIHEDRVTPKPSWLSGFSSTSLKVMVDDNQEIRSFSVYQKSFLQGETVTMGINSNDGTTQSLMYLVAVAPENPNSIVGVPVPYNTKLSVMANAVHLQTANTTTLQVFDLNGNVIRLLKYAPGNHVVSLAELPKGIYLVKASGTSIVKIPIK